MARANENANAQGNRDLNLAFIAFKRADANSEDWPPDRNAIAGTAAGTARRKQFTVAPATSSKVGWIVQAMPSSFCCRIVSS
jgi:hypothetical protein